MEMKTVKLTNQRVQGFLMSADIGQRLYDSQTAGFHLRKLKGGGFFYLAYKTRLGKRRIMPLGRFSENTCDQARNQAKEYAGRVIAGDDILATRQAEKQLAAKTGLDFIRLTYRPIQARKNGRADHQAHRKGSQGTHAFVTTPLCPH
jgi:hypothetical protein